MQYDREVTRVTNGIVLLALAACSGKSQQPAAIEDAKRSVVIDAAPPDARPPFFVLDHAHSSSPFVEVHAHDAPCPGLEWRREPKSVRIIRCPNTELTAHVDALRDMVAYLRTIEPSFEEVRVDGGADFYSYPEFARRLIAYAKTHPFTSKQSANSWVREAGAQPDMFPELAVIFQRKPKLTSLEKCWAGRASGKDPQAEFLRAAGVKGNTEIVLGCSMGFWELER